MKYAAISVLLAAFLLALALWSTGPSDSGASGRPEAAEPSTADAAAGGSKKKEGKDTKGPVADNTACFVCHANYDEETLAGQHAKANVGCVKCHGESVAHRNDEDNITPPDIMFPTDQIDKECVKCHETHDAPARKVIATWQKRCPAKENPADLVCTDCHGEHRLKFRTVWWDRKTHKLATSKGQRVKYNPDYTKKPGEAPAKPAASAAQ